MGHYYEQAASGVEPRHFVSMSTRPGELRPTRISDVRKWWKEGRRVVPSVTTILNVLDKPALANWKVEQHINTCAMLDRADDDTRSVFCEWTEDGAGEQPYKSFDLSAYVAEVKRLTELQMDIAPSAGTDVHKVLENFFGLGKLPESELEQLICHNVSKALVEHTGTCEWETERNFVHDGFGGQVDLSECNPDWVLDYKSKQTAEKFKPGKMVYPEHSMQLGAYRQGLKMPKARAGNIFVCLENGEVDFHEHTEDELSKGWELFKHCLAIWKIQNE